MKLFRFHDPLDYRFAQAARLGTWYPHPSPGVCPECGASQQRRVPPLIIEWSPGSSIVGDFVWPGGEVVVSQRVRDALEGRFSSLKFEPVKMWQEPKLKPPLRITKRTKPRVWLPYRGPPLYELDATVSVHPDFERSTVCLAKACSTCGREVYDVRGVEEQKSRWDPIRKSLVKVSIPRQLDKGIYVHKEDLHGAGIFRMFEIPTWILCIEEAKAFIEGLGFTNVSFLEVGNTLPDLRTE